MQRFETRGVYPIVLPPLAFFGFIFVAAIYVRHPLAVLFGLIALPFITDFTAKIGVEKDGVIIKRVIFGTSYWSLDEVRFKAGGRILVYGSRIYGGWIMPFKWRECIKAVEALRPMVPLEYKRAPSKIVPLIYLLVPPTTLTLIGYLVRHVGLVINPAVWAILWGITTASSFAVAVYTAPIRFKIGGFDKAVSSIITGYLLLIICFISHLGFRQGGFVHHHRFDHWCNNWPCHFDGKLMKKDSIRKACGRCRHFAERKEYSDNAINEILKWYLD